MKKLFKIALSAVAALAAFNAVAQEPAITMRTGIYDTAGPNNACTIVVGGTQGKYIEVDCGFGPVEYELNEYQYDSSSETVKGTPISCQVSSEGIIKIYTDDDAVIDYFNAEGCTLEWIEFTDPSKIEVLNLNHNSLSGLDLSDFTELRIAYLSDNPYDKSPLVIGKNHPELLMLEINVVYNIEPDFDIDTYPNLLILDAFAVPGITKIDPSKCPRLTRLSIDCTNVSSLDVTKNPELVILNISETGISEIDLSKCTKLQQLYCTHGSDTYNPGVKIKNLDVTALPNLVHLFATGNAIESIDVSNNTYLDHLWLNKNRLKELNVDNCPYITSLYIDNNYFDYVTLPPDRESYNEYQYGQHPFEVPVQVEVGQAIDLSSRVNRPGTETYARLVSFKRENPFTPIEVDASKYTYNNGVLTVNQAIADSVYIEFVNSEFTYPSLTTSHFMVKNAADIDKPVVQMTFQPATAQGNFVEMCIGIEGASAESPRNIHISQSDGSVITVPVTESRMPSLPNVKYPALGWGQTTLSVDEGNVITAVGIDGVTMYSCNVTPMSSLRQLRLTGAGLYHLDLGYNRLLESLTLTGNHFSEFNLDGVSGAYIKTALNYVDLSDNEMSALTLSYRKPVLHLDLHGNKFETIDFIDADNIQYLDISHNQLTELTVNYQGVMTELNASYNKLSAYKGPETDALRKADFSHNCFTYSNLPARGNCTEFIYAPQSEIEIAVKAPGIDLSSEAITVDGNPVVFTWYKKDGTPLTEGTDYTITGGRTRFLATDFGPAYCALTCAAFPDFSGENVLRTTDVIPTEMPTNVVASFTTVDNGTMHMSLGAHHNGSVIYIDWSGDGTDVVEYTLNDSYRLFDAQTKAGASVRVLSPSEDNDLRVFSVDGVALKDFDGSKMNELVTLGLSGTKLDNIVFPESDQLSELTINGNNLLEFNPSQFPKLRSFAAGNNKFTSLDFTQCPDIAFVAAAGNQLTEVKFAPDNKVILLDLDNNLLESYDAQQHPMINQLGIAGNRLTEINVDNLPDLRILALDRNRFTFATLPVPDAQWRRYTYSNQATVDAVVDGLTVDLSSQKEVNGTPTVYRWFIGEPTYNYETGELEGEELIAGEEYTIEGGVTTLVQGYEHMLCVMTNEVLPNVVLTTNFIDFSGIEAVVTDKADAEAVYYNLSGVRVERPGKGLYIVVRGNRVSKEIIR